MTTAAALGRQACRHNVSPVRRARNTNIESSDPSGTSCIKTAYQCCITNKLAATKCRKCLKIQLLRAGVLLSTPNRYLIADSTRR